MPSTPIRILLPLALASSSAAQAHFRELLKTVLPPASSSAQCMAIGDFDGDGDPDLALGTEGGRIRLFTNNGYGAFTDASQRLPNLTPLPVTALAFADLDRDGQVDLVVAARGGLTLLLARGSTFADETATRLGAVRDDARDLAVFDADRDGDLDLLTVNVGQHRLFGNDGRGRFTDITATTLPVVAGGRAVVAADVDRDGDLDLFIGGRGGDQLLFNDGAGRFADASAALIGPSGESTSVAALDIDRDGDVDLLAGRLEGPALFLQQNRQWFMDQASGLEQVDAVATGDVDRDGWHDVLLLGPTRTGLFLNRRAAPWLTFPSQGLVPEVWTGAKQAAFVDLDFDADLDLIVASPLGTRIHFNDQGSGMYLATPDRGLGEFPSEVAALLAVDFERDGDLDVQVLGSTPRGSAPGNPARLLRNDGYGVLAPGGGLPAGLRHAVFADFDGDGWPDLAACDDRGERLFLNDRGRSYLDVSSTNLPPALDVTYASAAGDVDGDGDVDLVFGNLGQTKLYVNDGRARFFDGTPGRLPIVTDTASAVVLVDLDGDRDLDLAIGNLDRPSRVAVNDGSGRFTDLSSARFPSPAPAARAIATADFDADGDLDLLFGTSGQSRLYRNDRGTFTDITATALPSHADAVTAIAVGDIDGDADIDVVLGILGQNRLWRNDGRGTFVDATAGLPAAPGPTRALLLIDLDADLDLDLVEAASTVRIYTNLTRQLDAPGFATLGAPCSLDAWVEPWNPGRHVVVPFLATSRLLHPQATPLGALGLDLSTSVALPTFLTTAGSVRMLWPIPANIALRGMALHWQAAITLSTAARTTRLSGLVSDRIDR